MATLVVARPLVSGEHPGLVSDFSDPGGMILTFLTLLACAAWAGWRVWRGQTALYFGWADFAVLALSLAVFLGAGHAPYRRPAWLAGWDWVGLALLFVLVRQLAVRPEERHGLVALLLASVVALSAEGLLQALYELPRQRAAEKALEDKQPETGPGDWLRGELAMRGETPTQLEFHELSERYAGRRVYGPYYHPESLASALVLAVPLLIGALFACYRSGAGGWQVSLVGLSLVLTLAVLVCTRCWTGVSALGVVLLLATGFAWPARLGGKKVGVILALVVSIVGLFGLRTTGVFDEQLQRLPETWSASWRMILDHAALGVGPAQYASFYPRYMLETSGAKAVNPSNAVLEVWAEAGVFGVLALAAVVLLFGLAIWRWWHAPVRVPKQKPEAHPSGSPEADTEPLVAWEFYLGGMIGLVLAFILRASHLPTDDIIPEALAAGVRAVVWFMAFGLFESIAWSDEEQVGALTAAVAAMFLTLLVQPGIGFPSVAVLLWVSVGLTLAIVSPEPSARLSRLSALNALAIPAFLAGAFGYFAFVFYPAAASASAMRRSNERGAFFLSEVSKSPQLRSTAFEPIGQLQRVLEPLHGAVQDDPDNVRLLVALSAWYSQLARWSTGSKDLNPAERALFYAHKAREANPEGPEGYFAEYVTNLNFAKDLLRAAETLEKEKPDPKRPTSAEERSKTLTRLRATARKRYGDAAASLEAYCRKRDPNDAAMRVLVAEALFGEGRTSDALEQARQAEVLDKKARPPRKLSDQQRQQLEEWRKQDSKK